MPDFKNEVAQALYTMLNALTVLKDRGELSEPIGYRAAEFNDLLARAGTCFQNADVVLGIAPLSEQAPFGALITGLIRLKGRVDLELMAGPSYEYWRRGFGEYWAVELRHGRVQAACGPLSAADAVPELLPYLPYDDHLAYWITTSESDFTRVRSARVRSD